MLRAKTDACTCQPEVCPAHPHGLLEPVSMFPADEATRDAYAAFLKAVDKTAEAQELLDAAFMTRMAEQSAALAEKVYDPRAGTDVIAPEALRRIETYTKAQESAHDALKAAQVREREAFQRYQRAKRAADAATLATW